MAAGRGGTLFGGEMPHSLSSFAESKDIKFFLRGRGLNAFYYL